MRLYDSMTQEKRDFVPRDQDHVTMYFCGPTVYNYVHVGNARPYVVSLVAKRYFESLGYKVTAGGETSPTSTTASSRRLSPRPHRPRGGRRVRPGLSRRHR